MISCGVSQGCDSVLFSDLFAVHPFQSEKDDDQSEEYQADDAAIGVQAYHENEFAVHCHLCFAEISTMEDPVVALVCFHHSLWGLHHCYSNGCKCYVEWRVIRFCPKGRVFCRFPSFVPRLWLSVCPEVLTPLYLRIC